MGIPTSLSSRRPSLAWSDELRTMLAFLTVYGLSTLALAMHCICRDPNRRSPLHGVQPIRADQRRAIDRSSNSAAALLRTGMLPGFHSMVLRLTRSTSSENRPPAEPANDWRGIHTYLMDCRWCGRTDKKREHMFALPNCYLH
ncbi:hypothetical protein GGR57DRAFT_397467 [Xylariaceae sp. FL1272]|nr:hypothetical protein GGR57DRAFT_397467 [Xylariaceae sp. FL1272]